MAKTAWDSQGYQKLARLLGRYPEAAIFRRFGSLDMITLLSLQAKLVVLERELRNTCYQDDISSEAEVKEYSTYFLKLHGAQAPHDAQLKKLNEIKEAMKEYYDLLTRSAQVAQLSRPENYQVRFLQDWLEGEQEGKDFLKLKERFTWHSQYQEDFVTLVTSKSWINPKLLDFFHWLGSCAQPADPTFTGPPDIELGRVQDFDSSRFATFGRVLWRIFVTVLASMLPILAVLVLYFVHPTLDRIAIAIGFTIFVGLFLITFTSATVKEIFGATAAFAAVVVVFIGSVNETGTPKDLNS